MARASAWAREGRRKLFLGTGCSVIAILNCFWHPSLATVDDRILEYISTTWPAGFPMFCVRSGYQAGAFLHPVWVALVDARDRQTDTQCDTDDVYIEAEFVTDSSNWPGPFITFVAAKYIQEYISRRLKIICLILIYFSHKYSVNKKKRNQFVLFFFFFLPMLKCSALRMEL